MQPEVEGAPVAGTNPPTPADKTFTIADIENARKQEKDKVYGRLTKQEEAFHALQAEVKRLQDERDARVAEEARRREEAEAALRAERENDLSAKDLLAEREAEWNSRFQRLEEDRRAERALLEKEREFATLQAFIQRRVSEEVAAETIAPQLVDYITGNTPEEVEESIDLAKAKTNAILEEVGNAQLAVRAQQRGVSPTGYAPAGPMDTEPGHQTVTSEQLKNMSMRDFGKLREKLGIGGATRDRGMFG